MSKELTSFLEQRDYFSEHPQSICPVCFRLIPGVIRESAAGLLLEKTCPEHGVFKTTVCTDLQRYKALCIAERKVTRPLARGGTSERGCPHDCGLCPSHEQHTCLAIMEITSRCDLGCPICLAGSGPRGEDLQLSQIEYALRRLMEYEGGLTPLQLSGGEPTLHPQLIDIVKLIWSLGGQGIELNTNGVALSNSQDLAERLMQAGLGSVYLQMDSLDPRVSRYIRGKDMVETKVKAMENCLQAGLEVVLSVTVVPGVNDQELWEMVRFGMEHHLTGVNFQALTLTGRYPREVHKGEDHFTSGHFLREMQRQSNGALREGDLTPIPCPDPRCGLLCYALVHRGELLPLNRLVEKGQLIDCLADLRDWSQTLRHIRTQTCGPCCGPKDVLSLGPLSEALPGSDFFSIGFHAMMDPFCLDLDRIKRCCVHELTPAGKLIPFCFYNTRYRQAPNVSAPS